MLFYNDHMSSLIQDEMMPLFGRGEVILPQERALNLDERVQVDLQTSLADPDEMGKRIGLRGNLVAAINAGGKRFIIVDARGMRSNESLFIADEAFSIRDNFGFERIEEGEPVIIGRGHYTDKFEYPATVSRDHFEIAYIDNKLFVHNLHPTNKTVITAHLATGEEPRNQAARHIIEAVRTHQVEDRMREHPNFGEKDGAAPYGYYLNHPILGRASKSVDGGVYMGGSAREAIVVDGKSQAMKQVYKGLGIELRRSFERNETLSLRATLLKVMNRVQEVMPYDGRKTEDISREHHGDKLVGLSTYLKERAGVCRHQALLAAYILENLINDGHMLGAVGVERNTVEDMGGTHAWAVYETGNNSAGEVMVIDPAQSFVGTKAQAQHEGRWEYRLTTDEY
jgi:hypothetical protein